MGAMNALVTILTGSNAVLALFPTFMGVALAIKRLLAKDQPDYIVQVQGLENGIVASADRTIAMIDEWNANNPE